MKYSEDGHLKHFEIEKHLKKVLKQAQDLKKRRFQSDDSKKLNN